MHIRSLLVIFILLMRHAGFSAAPCAPIQLEENKRIELRGRIGLYEDRTGRAGITDITALCSNGRLLTGDSIPAELVENRSYWIHFAINNRLEHSLPWMLQFGTPVSNAAVYAICTDPVSGIADTIVTHAESVNNYHKLKIEINPHSGCTTQYFVRFYQQLPMPYSTKNISLIPYSQYTDSFIEQASLVGFFVGIMFLLFMYHTFMLAVRRQKLYFFYVMYLFFHIGYVLYGSYYVEYVLIERNQMAYSWMYMSFSFGIFFYTLFIRTFIGRDNMPCGVDKWFFRPYIVFLTASNIGMLVLLALSNSWFYRFYMLIPLIYSILGLFLALTLIIRISQLETRLVLIGSVITVTSGISATVMDLYSLADNNHIYNLGMVADVLFYSYAINLKHRHEKRRAKEQQAELISVKDKIETQQRELTMKALYINQQDHILNELRSHIQLAQDNRTEDEASMSSLLSTIERHAHQSSWEEFERYFIEVHPSFYASLKDRFPALTQNELRLCALLRLNLNTKQIADITQKTPKSIDVTRSRIRQKLNLHRDDSLYDIIAAV